MTEKQTKKPKHWMTEAYQLGQTLRAVEEAGKTVEWIYDNPDCSLDWLTCDPVANAFYSAGYHGTAMPEWRSGWRYGGVPETGYSWNYRDGRGEAGISLMQLDGEEKVKTLAELFGSFDGRPVVHLSGWLVTHDVGGDGEPLLVQEGPYSQTW